MTSGQATPVAEISGITGYRLLGLLIAIGGLVKTVWSVKGGSAPVSKLDLVFAGVFGIVYSQIMCHVIHSGLLCTDICASAGLKAQNDNFGNLSSGWTFRLRCFVLAKWFGEEQSRVSTRQMFIVFELIEK